MREIKFRAWDKMREEMAEVTNLDFHPTVISLSTGTGRENGEFELMQYTGLKDQNGVEIYEGDIVKADRLDTKGIEWIGVVEPNEYGGLSLKYYEYSNYFKDGQWLAMLAGSIHDPQTASFVMESCTVIGNIYENPELLDQQ